MLKVAAASFGSVVFPTAFLTGVAVPFLVRLAGDFLGEASSSLEAVGLGLVGSFQLLDMSREILGSHNS